MDFVILTKSWGSILYGNVLTPGRIIANTTDKLGNTHNIAIGTPSEHQQWVDNGLARRAVLNGWGKEVDIKDYPHLHHHLPKLVRQNYGKILNIPM